MAEPPQAGAAAVVTAVVTATLALWSAPTDAAEISGRASYYAPGLMQEVARLRGLDTNGYLGGVALNRAGDLGRAVWLHWPDGAVLGPFVSVDCARQDHFAAREAAGYAVEVPAWVARLRGFYGVGPAEVTVRFAGPPIGKVPC